MFHKKVRFNNHSKSHQSASSHHKPHFLDKLRKDRADAGPKLTAGNITTDSEKKECVTTDDNAIQCFLCHQRGDHKSSDCPNVASQVQYINRKFEEYKAQNDMEDRLHPNKRYRVCILTLRTPEGICIKHDAPCVPNAVECFSAPIAHGPQYAMLMGGRQKVAMDSGASRSLFRRREVFSSYEPLFNTFVYTASGEAVPVQGRGQ